MQLQPATRCGASQHLEEERADDIENESVEQIAFADKLLLNKALRRTLASAAWAPPRVLYSAGPP